MCPVLFLHRLWPNLLFIVYDIQRIGAIGNFKVLAHWMIRTVGYTLLYTESIKSHKVGFHNFYIYNINLTCIQCSEVFVEEIKYSIEGYEIKVKNTHCITSCLLHVDFHTTCTAHSQYIIKKRKLNICKADWLVFTFSLVLNVTNLHLNI